MTREELRKFAIKEIETNKYIILEATTGLGKTKIAIDLINIICDRVFYKEERATNILIVVAKNAHKITWLEEIDKWGGLKSDNVIIECYESLKKYKNRYFDVVVLDECQHLSEQRRDILKTITINENCIGLSATIKKEMREYFKNVYKASILEYSLKEAVKNKILPKPTVYLFPLVLDNKNYKFKAQKFKKEVILTQKGYYDNISSYIEWAKDKFYHTRNEFVKNMWLSAAGNRLRWLAEQKEFLIISLLKTFKNYRTITFCSTIEQSEKLGKNSITSHNKKALKILNDFNTKKIKHVTAVNILNESVNLVDCRIGIFNIINSSEIMTKQKIGRLLRHQYPIIIIPYFKFTREEEIVNKIIKEYMEGEVKIIHTKEEIEL